MTEQLTWTTEQRNPASLDIDTRSTAEMVSIILAEDATVVSAVAAVASEITAAIELVVRCIESGGRVHYVGAGTSGRMGVLDAVELLPTYGLCTGTVVPHLAGGKAAMTVSIEGAEDDAPAGARLVRNASDNDLFIGIAASGRTPYVRGALQAAREHGLSTVLIAGNPRSPIARWADVGILFETGPEVITGSTRMKAATAQKIILNTISTSTMIRLGKTYSNLMINMRATNDKLQARSIKMLVQGSGKDGTRCAETLANARGSVRTALVALLADVPVDKAASALGDAPADANRSGDPSGIRTAVAALRSTSDQDAS